MKSFRTIVVSAVMVMVVMAGSSWAAQGDPVQTKKPQHHVATKQGTHGRYDRGPTGMFGPCSHLHDMAAYLGLSREQVAKIQQVFVRAAGDSRDLKYDLLQRGIEMHRLFTDPKTSTQTLMAKAKELSVLRQRQMDRRMQALIEARSVLTPEQIQRLDDMPMMMGGGMGRGMMGHGMTGPGCPMMMGDGGMGQDMMRHDMSPCMDGMGADMAGPDNPDNQ